MLPSCGRHSDRLSTADQHEIVRQTQRIVEAANHYDLKALAPLEWEKSNARLIMTHLKNPMRHYRKAYSNWADLRLATRRDGTVRVYLVPPSSAMWVTVLAGTIDSTNHADTSEEARLGRFAGRIVVVSLVSSDGAHYLPLVSENNGVWRAMSNPDGFSDDNVIGLSSLEWVDVALP